MSEAVDQYAGIRVRGRNTDFPDVPTNASDTAQTPQGRPLDLATIRQFSFAQLERSTSQERPSTSGGLTHSTDFDFTVKRDAWKRETRDDLDFPLPSYTKQTIFYDFPRPGSLFTLDSGSPGSFLPPRKDSLAPSSIAESDGVIEVNMSALQMEIGMAIGSPTQAPAAWQSYSYQQQNYSPSPDMSLESRVTPQPMKPKSKWKMFGGLFGGKKQTVQAQNFYQLRPERTPVEENHQAPIRGWTTSEEHAAKQKPNVLRSHTAPDRFDMHYHSTETPEIVVDGSRVEESTQVGSQAAGLLGVNIPDIQMERYSVMFGSLLERSESTPSLLARRQATLERLKVVNDELAQKVSMTISLESISNNFVGERA